MQFLPGTRSEYAEDQLLAQYGWLLPAPFSNSGHLMFISQAVPLGARRHCAPLTTPIEHPLLSGTLGAAALPHIPQIQNMYMYVALQEQGHIRYTPRVASILAATHGGGLTGPTAWSGNSGRAIPMFSWWAGRSSGWGAQNFILQIGFPPASSNWARAQKEAQVHNSRRQTSPARNTWHCWG